MSDQGNDELKGQVTGLKRRVSILEAENGKYREAIEYTVRTLDLHKDPTANPLAKMCDRATAEAKLRDAIAPPKESP
jgi:hypothetical protein